MITDKGETISVVVDMRVKLPAILCKDHKISIRGTELDMDQASGRFITNKHNIFYEGMNDQTNREEVQQIHEETEINTPPKLSPEPPPKPLNTYLSPQSVPESQDAGKSLNNIQNSQTSRESHSRQQLPSREDRTGSRCMFL